MKKAKFDKQPIAIGCLSFFKDNLFLVMGIILVMALCMYGIMGVFGFSAFPDEFGYWTPAAAMLGYDWSSITSLGSYYSYGYSAVLVFILAIFKDPIVTYRAAVIVNLLLQCIAVPMFYRIITTLFPSEHKNTRAVIALVSVLYPAWAFYTQTTMAEALLYFLFVLAAYLMMKFTEKPGAIKGFFLAVVLVYCYFVHMRCLGIIGAGIFTIIIWLFSKRKAGAGIGKKAWLIPLFIIALFAVSFIIKGFVIDNLYSDASREMLNWNDYTSIPDRLLDIVRGDGIKFLLQDIAGKLLYIGLATYGIGYFGIFCLCRHFFESAKRIIKRTATDKDIFWVFLFLATLAQFMVALIYLNGAASPENNRLDIYLHGRYIDFFLPILIGIGLEELVSGKKLIPVTIATFAMYGGFYFVARHVISVNNEQMSNAHGFTMIGMSYMLTRSPEPDVLGYLLKETLLGASLTVAVIAVSVLYRKLKQPTILLLVLAIQVVLSLNACNHYIFPYQSYIYGDILIGEKLKELREEFPDRNVIYSHEGGPQYIELVQFADRDADIMVLNGKDQYIDIQPYLSEENMIILSEVSEHIQEAEAFYNGEWQIAHLYIFYMKGEG
ncbi:MAG: hypothetical protein IKO76_02255 [Butyrivibrio sp.]|nr:hypothetical protein [Butyrivibrio sp.]